MLPKGEQKVKIVIIGGDFNDDGGRPSGYIKKFAEDVSETIPDIFDRCNHLEIMNGGYFDELETQDLSVYDIIIWLANVPNDKPKIIRTIKLNYPTAILVTSKNNIDGKYGTMDLVARALQTKSNLLIEFTKDEDGVIASTIIDPLCNCYLEKSIYIEDVTYCLLYRINELMSFTRIGSEQIGEAVEVPDNNAFFNDVKYFGDKFHDLIHGVNTSRFLGNASFRCEKGFPSMRDGDLIFVSRRNIDKREIGKDGFVACDANSLVNGTKVRYYGEHKPSVDTPIQLALYSYYKNIDYMIHSHVYVKNAPFTHSKIPCGAIQEAGEIIELFPWNDVTSFAINLKGHGSIIGSSDLMKYYSNGGHIARPVPES
jgi:hypothetical protein